MYYHISKNLEQFDFLQPSIPHYLLPSNHTEERTIPRVCVAPSLEQAVFGLGTIHNLFLDYYDKVEDGEPETSYLYEEGGMFDTCMGEIGLPIRVYEIPHTPSISNEQIIQNRWVPDAEWTGESWFETNTSFERSYLYFITDVDDWGGTFSISGYPIDDTGSLIPAKAFDVCYALGLPKEKMLTFCLANSLF